MANKRMFTMKICDSDAFLDMPLSAQCLYFHLTMRADDDGFIDNPKRVMKVVGAKDDDMSVLIAKHFVLTFESGVMVIKHWRMHNSIAKTRYHETQYTDEKAMLLLKDNGSYSFNSGNPIDDAKYIEMYSGEQAENKRRTNGEQTENSVLGLGLGLDLGLDKDIESKGNKTKRERFVKPTIEQLEEYKKEKGLNIDCQYFLDFYDSKGWMIGKNHMKDWKATMRGWSAREKKTVKNPKNTVVNNFEQRQGDLDALLKNGVFKRS